MSPDALPQLMETLLRLPFLEAAELRELIQHQPDPRAFAQEMLRRGWITQDQFSSMFPDPQQQPAPRETMVLGVADDDNPPDADCDWILPLTDEEDEAEPEGEGEGEWALPDQPDEEKIQRPRSIGRTIKGLLLSVLFFGSFFAGLPFFWPSSTVPSAGRQESKEDNAGDPAVAADEPPAQVPGEPPGKVEVPLRVKPDRGARAPGKAEAPAPPNDPRPKSKASLYARVRQVVLENKTEETQRLGIGDFPYEDVPEDGSIMVGMEVTYAPFFSDQIIKSVRAIYQCWDGTRYDGPVCGNPTGVRERVVAREGYAIGAVAIKAGMGIDGMQLTFMEIGADGLNPNKTYLSRWLGGHGGSDAGTFVNDGRPIVGIAGMRARGPDGPAFCLCLVTTRPGALAAADGKIILPVSNAKQRDGLQNRPQQFGTPLDPQPAESFEQQVQRQIKETRQKILESQRQIEERAKQNMQMSQQIQERALQEMMQSQQQMMQRPPSFMPLHPQQIMPMPRRLPPPKIGH
jgi:hypothetical protein